MSLDTFILFIHANEFNSFKGYVFDKKICLFFKHPSIFLILFIVNNFMNFFFSVSSWSFQLHFWDVTNLLIVIFVVKIMKNSKYLGLLIIWSFEENLWKYQANSSEIKTFLMCVFFLLAKHIILENSPVGDKFSYFRVAEKKTVLIGIYELYESKVSIKQVKFTFLRKCTSSFKLTSFMKFFFFFLEYSWK